MVIKPKQDKQVLKDVTSFMMGAEKKIEEVEVTMKYEMPKEPSSLKDVNMHKGKGYMNG
jgi:hypothetical protein